MCTTDCGSDRSELSKYKCIRCGGRTRPHRSRLTPSGFYLCVKCSCSIFAKIRVLKVLGT